MLDAQLSIFLPPNRSMTTTLALVLSNHNLTNLTLRNFEKSDPERPSEYENCTIPNLLQHKSLTHLTLRNADITELNDEPSLSTESKIKTLDIGSYTGKAKADSYEKAAGILVEALADTLEALSLEVCPKISPSHRPFSHLRTLRLGPTFPVTSVTRTLQALTTDGKSDLQELEIRYAKDSEESIISALKAIKSGTFPSIRRIALRVNEDDDGESVNEISRGSDGAEETWDLFVNSLQSSQS